jgi:fumarate reductase flavoprotein subunit
MINITTEFAVVAAGPAGLAAAIAASEMGIKVCVFEKAAVPGGAARMGMGPLGIESKIQKRSMIGFKKEEAFKRFMEYVQWKADANLVRNYFWKSGDTIDWLEEMGVPFWGAGKYFPESEATWHKVLPYNSTEPVPGGGAVMCDIMKKRAEELGAVFYMETPVKRLITEDGNVTGLEAESKSGETYHVKAKAVLVATGGFSDNPEMIKEETGYEFGKDMFNNRVPGDVGDGLKMAWAAGAARSDITMEMILHTGIPRRFYNGAALFRQPAALVINANGQRLMNEEVLQNTAVSANIVKMQPRKSAYAIITDEIVEYYRKNGLDFPNFSAGPAGVLTDFEPGFANARDKYPDCAFIAGSIEELASQMDIPYEKLKETIDIYNESCELHYDDYMCKERRYLHKIEGKIYYAERIALGAYGSLGGIAINSDLEVIDTDGKVMSGFYAAGSDVCTIYAGTYMFYYPGNTMGFALNTGRMAGENAAAYIRKQEKTP